MMLTKWTCQAWGYEMTQKSKDIGEGEIVSKLGCESSPMRYKTMDLFEDGRRNSRQSRTAVAHSLESLKCCMMHGPILRDASESLQGEPGTRQGAWAAAH